MRIPDLAVVFPRWFPELMAGQGDIFPSVEDRAALAVELSRRSVEHGTGGPFGAAVFDSQSGRILGAGVNLVTSANCSLAHAEIVAIMVAQRLLGTYDLGAKGFPICELVCSCEPCAMCLGAIPWSGVRRLVCCARGDVASSLGFDEGNKPVDWIAGLEKRGISVTRDVAKDAAEAVLRLYLDQGGVIYNARCGS